MKISKILSEMGIVFECRNERDFSSLGLVEYNYGNDVCTFITEKKYLEHLSGNISMVITTKEIADVLSKHKKEIGQCITKDPRITFFEMHNYLINHKEYVREKKKTVIGKNCNISSLAFIAPYNVVIGDNVVIEEFCAIKENTNIGDNCIIRTGAAIGVEDFEFKRKNDTVFGVHHVGGVKIGHDVEIQSHSCIDKAIYPWDNTVIGAYTKIDDLVHVGHGVKIGKGCMIIANSAIGGRTKIGDNTWIGIGVQIRNGISIGDNARANMGAVVTKNIAAGESVSGNFAIEHGQFIKNIKKSAAE